MKLIIYTIEIHYINGEPVITIEQRTNHNQFQRDELHTNQKYKRGKTLLLKILLSLKEQYKEALDDLGFAPHILNGC